MREFVEFLGSQFPYDQLDAADLDALARHIEVEFFREGAAIITEGSRPLAYLYIVRTGSVEIIDRDVPVDVLGPGDTFGHMSVFSGLPPTLSVRAAEDTLCYALPDPRKIVARPERLTFAHYGTLVSRSRLIAAGDVVDRLMRPVTDFMQPTLWCPATDTAQSAARAMTDARRAYVLVDVGGSVGIVTDRDFRRRIATGEMPLEAPVHLLAHTPALTVDDTASAGAASLLMVEHGIGHLVVVDAGGKPSGVVSVTDLAAAEIHHPLLVRGAIKAARTIAELGDASTLVKPTLIELWDAEVSAARLAAVHSAIVDALLRKLISLHVADPGLAGSTQSWAVLGSFARREPLPWSDVDTALVWDAAGADARADPVRDAAGRVVADLPAAGMRACPDDANASHPLFNRSAQDWRRAIEEWAADPVTLSDAVLLTAVADARPITEPALGATIADAVLRHHNRPAVAAAVVRQALTERPPTGFVRGFVIGHRGERRGRLDLKRAGLRPVTSLARALAFHTEQPGGSTLERLGAAVDHGHLTVTEAHTLTGAFELFHDLLTDQQVEAFRTGGEPADFIATADLDPLARRHLRDAFQEVRQIQDRVARTVPGAS